MVVAALGAEASAWFADVAIMQPDARMNAAGGNYRGLILTAEALQLSVALVPHCKVLRLFLVLPGSGLNAYRFGTACSPHNSRVGLSRCGKVFAL